MTIAATIPSSDLLPADAPPVPPALIPPAPVPPARPSTWRFLRSLRTDVLGTFAREAYRRPVIAGRLFHHRFLLVNDPSGIRRVLVENAGNYVKPASSIRVLGPFTGEGLLLSEGDEWRGQRRRVAHAFAPAHLRALQPSFAVAAENMVRALDRGVPLDPALFEATALDAVLRALFSDAEAGRRERLQLLVREYLTDGRGPGRIGPLDLLARRPDSFSFLLRGRRRYSRRWFAEIEAVVAERRGADGGGGGGGDGGGAGDLLDGLLAARDADTGLPLPTREVLSQVATFVAAGFETTARLLFWTAYLLALDGDEQERVRAEVDGGDPADDADPVRRPRLRAVLQETLRLYPTAPIITRRALADDVVAGERVRAGDRVTISPWLVHRHERLWEDPAAFRPDRFRGKPNAYLTDDAFLPFSKGPRVCIGAGFALTEAATVLGALLRRYRVLSADGPPAMPVAVVSIRPDRPYAFRLVRR